MTLRQVIMQEIRDRGPVPFSRYMELCLYHPELGYYSRNGEQFGKAGDFYTSSDVHAVFGRLLARQFDEMWRVLRSPEQIEILELGPGRGLFAQDVLDWSEKKFPEFFRAMHYSLVERSPALRERITKTLAKRFGQRKAGFPGIIENVRQNPDSGEESKQVPRDFSPAGAEDDSPARKCRVEVENDSESRRDGTGFSHTQFAPRSPVDGPRITRALAPEVPIIIFANEFFDALPVEILSPQGALRICEQGLAAAGESRESYQEMPSGMPSVPQDQPAFRRRIPDADSHRERLAEAWVPASPEELEFLDRYSVQPEEGERIEVPLSAQRTMAESAALVQRGFILAIDYGYTRQEQLSGRHRGTLAAYRQHSASGNPYEAPGEQDITAHVNLTALADAVAQQGMTVQPLLTQSQFLLGIGEHNQFMDAFEECRLPQERAKVGLQLKHLITPEGMGETFHVLLASKGVASEEVSGLSGLGFGRGRGDLSLA